MPESAVTTRKKFTLQGPNGVAPRIVSLVTGPHPYLWIVGQDGDFYAATESTEQLRALRDEITKALHHAY